VRAEGRVDKAVGATRSVERDADRVREESADPNRRAGARVRADELGVLTKAAARTIDLSEIAREQFACLAQRSFVRDRNDSGRPERFKARGCRRSHDPPETTTGACEVAAGATDGEEAAGLDELWTETSGGAGA